MFPILTNCYLNWNFVHNLNSHKIFLVLIISIPIVDIKTMNYLTNLNMGFKKLIQKNLSIQYFYTREFLCDTKVKFVQDDVFLVRGLLNNFNTPATCC